MTEGIILVVIGQYGGIGLVRCIGKEAAYRGVSLNGIIDTVAMSFLFNTVFIMA